MQDLCCHGLLVRREHGRYRSGYHLRAFTSTEFWKIATKRTRYGLGASIILAICNYQPQDIQLPWETRLAVPRGIIEAAPSKTTEPFNSKRWAKPTSAPSLIPPGFSADRVKAMLEDCLKLDKVCSSVSMSFPRGARVIDCVLRDIVPLNLNQRYLALSYVWGPRPFRPPQHDHQEACEPICLPETLPQTIQDAIKICLALNFRYLWIDRYCIKQYHSGDKKQQIEQMANIYSCATATICALGLNDNTGISGISRPFRSQYCAVVQDMAISWTGREVKSFVDNSAWSKRGWTLQELVLSPRCLFFTEDGVAVTCKGGIFHDNNQPDKPFPGVDKRYTGIREIVLFQGQNDEDFPYEEHLFETLRSNYLGRQLGHDSDAMNAFRAILSLMDAPSYWGIAAFPQSLSHVKPLSRRMKLSFIYSLCWATELPLAGSRRC